MQYLIELVYCCLPEQCHSQSKQRLAFPSLASHWRKHCNSITFFYSTFHRHQYIWHHLTYAYLCGHQTILLLLSSAWFHSDDKMQPLRGNCNIFANTMGKIIRYWSYVWSCAYMGEIRGASYHRCSSTLTMQNIFSRLSRNNLLPDRSHMFLSSELRYKKRIRMVIAKKIEDQKSHRNFHPIYTIINLRADIFLIGK